MIYNTSFMRKELRNAYMQQKFSRNRQFSLGLFLGLISFAIYFSLQTLKQSVVSDAAPQLMMPSYFSTLYIYLFVSLIFNVIFYITNYEYMTFIEVIRNRWYPLVQLGYKPTRLIAQKLIGRFVFQGAVYSIGFTATIFLSSFCTIFSTTRLNCFHGLCKIISTFFRLLCQAKIMFLFLPRNTVRGYFVCSVRWLLAYPTKAQGKVCHQS